MNTLPSHIAPITVGEVLAQKTASIPAPRESEIASLFTIRQKIAVIKWLRQYTFRGLKDTKDFVDWYMPYREFNTEPTEGEWNAFRTAIQPIFDAYLPAADFRMAILTVLDNWKALGFKTPYGGVRVVMSNFEA
jgi:hypothetical protein